MGHRGLRGVAWLGLVLSLSLNASAQSRRGAGVRHNPYGRQHRLHRRAPSAASEAPRATGPWNAARARFILSAESLLGFTYFRQSADVERDGLSQHTVQSGTELHLLKSGEPSSPYGEARIGLDAVVGPGVTLGGGIGYSTTSEDSVTEVSGSTLPPGDETSTTKLSILVLAPRVGYVLAPSRYVAVWLRLGVTYASLKVTSSTEDLSQGCAAIKFDPMLVITPLPHVGLMIGPDLNVGVAGSLSGTVNGRPLADERIRSSAYGLNAGLALLF